MTMERETGSCKGSVDGSDRRWQCIWSHREQLLKVARRRSLGVEDAEDAVHEAMVRAWEKPDLDESRVGAWLTTVTIRLCVDRHRQMSRETDVQGLSPAASSHSSVEEVVCDRLEADWLAQRSSELPPRQAHALWLKSANLDVAQVAEEMGLSYRTVESLLARGRRTLRRLLAGALAFGTWHWVTGWARTGGGAVATGVASTAATLAVLGLLLPGGAGPGADGPRPATTRPGGPAAGPGGPGASAAAMKPAGSRGSGAGAGRTAADTGLPVAVFALPGPVGVLRTDTLPASHVTDVSVRPGIPHARLPGRVASIPSTVAQHTDAPELTAPAGPPVPRPSSAVPSPGADVPRPAAPDKSSVRTPIGPSATSEPLLGTSPDDLP
ncbi:RNA polymerase sigma factor [Streptomyces sp. WMMB 322]|uniref:RNA polymerase sigma factor n=1 Tax=Streptomyces sp. WMMB 322 TaxID=1286821 RepID=UPI000823F10B|nr:sigma-70 family RNA polymerase sigma factor [Streptomyces sp. WMMB 322]SCK27793.1 RNA polymerase sigma factor, sigma-70 family [Streptomyces sp. WMMB 322]